MLSDRLWTWCAIGVAVAALVGAFPVGQHGVRGTYFRSDNWTGESVDRVDPRPSDVGVALALGPGPPQRLSVVWSASLVVDRADTYQLRITTTAVCRVTLDALLAVDSRVPGIPTVALKPGVYPLAIHCSTTGGKLNLGVWWDKTNVDPKPLSSAVLFPSAMTLEEFRTLASIEQIQRLLLMLAAGAGMLLALDWAVTRGPFGWLVLIASAAATAAVHFDWPAWIRGPIVEEWQWGYQPGPFERPFFAALAFGIAVLAAIGLAATPIARRAPRRAAFALIGFGVVAGFGFELGLLDTSPGGWRQSLIASAWSGIGFLRSAGYVADMPISGVIHRYSTIMPTLAFKASTHPPGGTLMFRALMGGARRAGLRGIEANALYGPPTTTSAIPVTRIALVGALAWAASASLTVLPIALAAWAVSRDPRHAVVVALLWVFCPSPTVMVPSLDQLQTMLVASSFALLLFAQSAPGRPALLAGVAGAIAGIALFFSYGTAPMLATGLLMAGVWSDAPGGRRRYAGTAASWLAGAAIAVLAPVLAFGFPLVSTVLQGLNAHRALTATRSAALWLRYNVLDYGMWLGAATLVAIAVALKNKGRGSVAWRLTLCVCLALVVSDLSGTARGEVGRLWMPFMPLMFVAAWTPSALRHPRDGVVIGAVMMVYCFAVRLHWNLWFFDLA